MAARGWSGEAKRWSRGSSLSTIASDRGRNGYGGKAEGGSAGGRENRAGGGRKSHEQRTVTRGAGRQWTVMNSPPYFRFISPFEPRIELSLIPLISTSKQRNSWEEGGWNKAPDHRLDLKSVTIPQTGTTRDSPLVPLVTRFKVQAHHCKKRIEVF